MPSLLGLLVLLGACTSAPSVPTAPDVLLVVMGGVRADRLQTYGHERPTSGQLEAISQAGVIFEDVTADGTWAWPGQASISTGQPPWISGAHWRQDSVALGAAGPKAGVLRVSPMRTDLPTLADRFSAAGYRTVSLSSSPLLHPALGLTRGFARAERLEGDAQVAQAAAALIAEPSEKPLFLMVHLSAARSPYAVVPAAPWSTGYRRMFIPETTPGWMRPYKLKQIPPALALTQRASPDGVTGEQAYASGALRLREEDLVFIRDLYDGELLAVDEALAQLVGAWSASGRTAEILAVTSDHGQYLGEDGQIGPGLSVYPGVTSVPMVIAAPGRLPASVRVRTPVQLSDIYPTLLDLSGVSPGEPGSLRAVVEGQPRTGPIQAAAWPRPGWAGQIGGRFALGHRLYREGPSLLISDTAGGAALYDLSKDGRMVDDRSADQPARLQRMRAASTGAFPEQPSAGEIQVPDEVLRPLRALGYLE